LFSLFSNTRFKRKAQTENLTGMRPQGIFGPNGRKYHEAGRNRSVHVTKFQENDKIKEDEMVRICNKMVEY
jgi:hypothetical protein